MKHEIIAYEGEVGTTAVVPANIQEALARANQQANSQAFDKVAKAGDWLPRLQLIGGNSGLCQDGTVKIGCYALITSSEIVTDIGKNIDMLVLTWRPKALDTTVEPPLSVFDVNDPRFKVIEDKSGIKDSGCMYGPEFLVWLPAQQKFATFFLGSPTGRREAVKLKPLIGSAATLTSKLIETDKYKWHGPVVTACSVPLTPPDLETLNKELERFLNPPKSQVEQAAPETIRER